MMKFSSSLKFAALSAALLLAACTHKQEAANTAPPRGLSKAVASKARRMLRLVVLTRLTLASMILAPHWGWSIWHVRDC